MMPMSIHERFSMAWNRLVMNGNTLWEKESDQRPYLKLYKEMRERAVSALSEARFVARLQKDWHRRYQQRRGSAPAEIFLLELEAVGNAAAKAAEPPSSNGDETTKHVLGAISTAYGSASDLFPDLPWWAKATLIGGKEVADIFKRP